MVIRAQVVDQSNGEPLPGATATVVDKDGKYLGQGVAADNDGKFSLTSSILDGEGVKVMITSIDFVPVLVQPAMLTDPSYMKIGLEAKSVDLGAFIFSPHKGSWWPWMLLTGGILLLATGKHKKKGGRK